MSTQRTAETTAGDHGSSLDAAQLEERIAALSDHCRLGPSYDRSVAAHVADARLFASRGMHDAAYRQVLLAEVCAGLLSWERFCELDPWKASRP